MKNKRLTITYISVIAVIVLQAVDVLFIHKDGSLFGNNFIARIAGIGVAIIASILLNFNIKSFCFKTYNWFFEIIYGVLFAAVPFIICIGGEFVSLTFKGYNALKFNIWFPNTNDDMSIKGTILAMGLFTATIILEAVFQEMFFRGFLITQFHSRYGMSRSNIIQDALFIIVCIPEIYTKINADESARKSITTAVFIIICYILSVFVAGFKCGLYYRASGTLWMATADHFAYKMLMQCIYITYSTMPLKWYVLQALALQLMSLVLFIPLYFRRDKLNEEIATETAVRKELSHLQIDNYSPSPLRHFFETRSKLRREEFARIRSFTKPIKETKNPSDFEEPVSLSDSGFFTEAFQPSDNLKNISSGNAVTYEGQPEDEGTAKIGENGKNISDLVNDYFEDNFNKHTF